MGTYHLESVLAQQTSAPVFYQSRKWEMRGEGSWHGEFLLFISISSFSSCRSPPPLFGQRPVFVWGSLAKSGFSLTKLRVPRLVSESLALSKGPGHSFGSLASIRVPWEYLVLNLITDLSKQIDYRYQELLTMPSLAGSYFFLCTTFYFFLPLPFLLFVVFLPFPFPTQISQNPGWIWFLPSSAPRFSLGSRFHPLYTDFYFKLRH